MRLLIILSIFGLASQGSAQERLPIIDVHMHAFRADAQGPPPLAMCTPINPMPYWDPGEPYSVTFMKMMKEPTCTDPVWSPETDQELLQQNIEVMERLNIFGVLSGSPDRVDDWVAALPGRFIRGLAFNVGDTDITPEKMAALHTEGSTGRTRLYGVGPRTRLYGVGPAQRANIESNFLQNWPI